jgi:hypothetical protein
VANGSASKGEAEAMGRTRAEAATPARARPDRLALFVWGVAVGRVAYGVIGPKLYLICHYGWASVRRDGLSVVKLFSADHRMNDLQRRSPPGMGARAQPVRHRGVGDDHGRDRAARVADVPEGGSTARRAVAGTEA